MTLSDMVGASWPMPTAIHFADLLQHQADLGPGKSILDIGCGCGRIATALVPNIGPQGSYVGVDIVPGLIDFARRRITSSYPNFKFLVQDMKNPAYDSWKTSDLAPDSINDLDESCERETIDIVLAASLFTHFDFDMASKTLKSIHRALKPDGCALVTAFLIDEGTRSIIERGRSPFTFKVEYGDGVWVDSIETGLGSSAFEYSKFIKLLDDSGYT